MIKLYKFYKNNCSPCYVLARILVVVDMPEDVELVNINVENEENKAFALKNEIEKVPVLMFEDGRKLILPKSKIEVINFLKGEDQNAISN